MGFRCARCGTYVGEAVLVRRNIMKIRRLCIALLLVAAAIAKQPLAAAAADNAIAVTAPKS